MSAASSSSSSDISCPPALQAAVAAAIGATAQRNTSVPESTSLFDCKRGVPRISIESYIHRIARYSPCDAQVFVLLCVYIDRVTRAHPGLYLSPRNMHRLTIVSFVISMKFYSDRYYKNSYNARVGGIEVSELNTLEMHMLDLLGFHLMVTTDEYEICQQTIMKRAPLFQVAPAQPRLSSFDTPGSVKKSQDTVAPTPGNICAFLMSSVQKIPKAVSALQGKSKQEKAASASAATTLVLAPS